jgi:hypothetical protein
MEALECLWRYGDKVPEKLLICDGLLTKGGFGGIMQASNYLLAWIKG